MEEVIKKALASHKKALESLEESLKALGEIAELFLITLKNKGKIIFLGNGGSAADAQHLAAELAGRFKKERKPLAAMALSVNTSILTAIGNDYSFEEVFSRQIQALASADDLVVAISTSGKSKNIIKAVEAAKTKGVKTVGFLGKDGGDLSKIVDTSLVISSSDTAAIQEMHILAGHIICEIVDERH
jgi:D-sedoheptulose 7-phosphate isomerase